ncbi:hypothetical protein AC249_AIPGENE2121 [Exaiptasia diaphana]|nr:hypothetical protein AC249_AIPGENE2121 [Exaiptasia diaphana]
MPVDPNKPYTPVAAIDAGKAVALILINPAQHAGKTYNIVSNRHTMNEACQEFSRQLGKVVKFVQISYEKAKENFLMAGVPDWQVDGMIHSFRMMDEGSPASNLQDIEDFHRITNMAPTSLADWIATNRFAFQ